MEHDRRTWHIPVMKGVADRAVPNLSAPVFADIRIGHEQRTSAASAANSGRNTTT